MEPVCDCEIQQRPIQTDDEAMTLYQDFQGNLRTANGAYAVMLDEWTGVWVDQAECSEWPTLSCWRRWHPKAKVVGAFEDLT